MTFPGVINGLDLVDRLRGARSNYRIGGRDICDIAAEALERADAAIAERDRRIRAHDASWTRLLDLRDAEIAELKRGGV